MVIVGNVPVRQDCSFEENTGEQGFPNWTGRMDACFNWYVKVYRRFQDSKIASFRDLEQKANEKLKRQKVPETKDHRMAVTADLTPTVPPFPFSPEYSCFTHFLSEILFYSQENI